MTRITADSKWQIFFRDPNAASEQARAMATHLLDQILIPLLPVAGGYYELSSGARIMADIIDLEHRGYHPSRTSDHLFGLIEPTAGAADVVPAIGARAFFKYITANTDRARGTVKLPNGSTVSVGQIILEMNHTAWIHISNPRRIFWKGAKGLPTLLLSMDNGKNYTAA